MYLLGDWDSDMASLLLLLHVFPPQSPERKKTQKISACQAIDHLVMFHKSCRGLKEHIMREGPQQPYLLASGSSKQAISNFYRSSFHARKESHWEHLMNL
ncbi:hypothetical protein NFI96_026377, partial [Prochilodus magdalenae]